MTARDLDCLAEQVARLLRRAPVEEREAVTRTALALARRVEEPLALVDRMAPVAPAVDVDPLEAEGRDLDLAAIARGFEEGMRNSDVEEADQQAAILLGKPAA